MIGQLVLVVVLLAAVFASANHELCMRVDMTVELAAFRKSGCCLATLPLADVRSLRRAGASNVMDMGSLYVGLQ